MTGLEGLIPAVDWLTHSAMRKEALLTSQIEESQATLADLVDNEAGPSVANKDDVEEVNNYLHSFRQVRDTCTA